MDDEERLEAYGLIDGIWPVMEDLAEELGPFYKGKLHVEELLRRRSVSRNGHLDKRRSHLYGTVIIYETFADSSEKNLVYGVHLERDEKGYVLCQQKEIRNESIPENLDKCVDVFEKGDYGRRICEIEAVY